MHQILLFIYLIFGGVLGGLCASMASMASLATYPFLLSVGIPPVFANTTNDAAIIWNGVGSTIASTKELRGHWRKVTIYSLIAIMGSVIGCLLLIHFPGKVFEKVVPFCIAFSGILVLVSGKAGLRDSATLTLPLKILSWIALLITGIYAGYFGAASGVLMLAILSFITNDNFLTVNAMKNIAGSVGNLVALIIYMFTERIYWQVAIPMAIGVLCGSYLGQKLIGKISPRLVRITICILALGQSAYYAYTAYFK